MNRTDKKQQTRETILHCADRLFRDQGYDSVSTRDIAKQAGVAVGTVFAHFADKHQLTKALFHSKIDAKLAEYRPNQNSATSALDYFIAQSGILYRFYNEDRAFSKALLQSSVFDANYFSVQIDQYVGAIAELIASEKSNKDVSSSVVMAKAWFGFYMFNLFVGLSSPDSQPEDWLAKLQTECEQLLSLSLRTPN
jgi:AcrR family transcriptional regulator